MQLAGQLASRNESPGISNGEISWPKTFDRKEQDRVVSVLYQLNPTNEEEWDVVTQFVDDKRYALTGYEKDESTVTNYSVGMLCRRIARAQLEHIYGEYVPVDISDRPVKIVPPLPLIAKDRAGKHLWEIQSDVALRAAQKISDHSSIDKEAKQKAIDGLSKKIREIVSQKRASFAALTWDGMTWVVP
jgi:hypothetical protein